MDIHKPKPWHGWREFLKEYAIIVVGVLTALAAEQAVQAIHTSYKSAEAEELVREEFARNAAFAREKILTSPCNQAVFQLVERLLLGAPADRPVPPLKSLRLGLRPYSWRQWESAVASGAADHFPVERRLAYQRIYTSSAAEGRSMNSIGWSEYENVARLEVLTLAPRTLSADVRERLLEEATQASEEESWLTLDARHVLEFAAPLHLPPPILAASTHLATPENVKACLDGVTAEAAILPPIPTAAR